MRTLRVAAATFLLGGSLSLAAPAPGACAAEGPRAVLVVDTEQSGGQYRYCVALDDEQVSGIHVIELANEQYGLDYRLGYGGNAVCVLAGVGYESDECLKEGPEFWGYWRGNGSGGWNWSSTGAHMTVVEDGDVEGWSWGTGQDGSSHPQPPATKFGSVCEVAEDEPKKKKDTGGSGFVTGPKSTGGRSSGNRVAAAADIAKEMEKRKARRAERKRSKTRSKDKDRKRSGDAETPTPSPAATPVDVASEPTSTEGSSPLGIWLAAGAIVTCIGGGVALRRRRKPAT